MFLLTREKKYYKIKRKEGKKSMINENVCKFVPLEPPSDKIRTINFVAETKKQKREKTHLDAFFKVHFVLSGKGKIYKMSGVHELSENCIFFTFPSENYAIESNENFKYIYISYIGLRAGRLNQKIGIDFKNFVFYNCDEIADTLNYFFAEAQDSNLAEISESALLYIYAVLEKSIGKTSKVSGAENAILKMQKYINDNFSDCELTLEKISEKFSYNKNYVSTVFKQKTGVTISKYINTVRVQNACTLMKNGFTCVKDISVMCGIADSLYFSRLFKKYMGITPKEFILECAKSID